MSLRIALVTGEFPPMEGGVGAFTQELGRALTALGHEIHIVTHRFARPKRTRTPQPQNQTIGQAIRRVESLSDPVKLPFGTLHPVMFRWGWSDVLKLVDLCERYEFDVINVQYQAAAFNMRNPAVNFLPRRLSPLAKVVVTYHDLRTPYLFPKANRWREWVVWQMARRADGVIVTNDADREQLTPQLQGAETEIREIPIGSNIQVHASNHWEADEVHEDVKWQEGDVLLGFFGFINQTKGADTLIEALIELPKRFKVVFIGGQLGASDSRNNQLSQHRIQQLVEAYQLHERVFWTGFLSELRVSAFFNAADMIVMPYRDGVSLRRGTLMAALAHGRPVVSTTPKKPVEELVHGENIWLVDPDQPKALAKAILALSKDPERLERLSQGARTASEPFEWPKIAAQTAEFFESLFEPTP